MRSPRYKNLVKIGCGADEVVDRHHPSMLLGLPAVLVAPRDAGLHAADVQAGSGPAPGPSDLPSVPPGWVISEIFTNKVED